MRRILSIAAAAVLAAWLFTSTASAQQQTRPQPQGGQQQPQGGQQQPQGGQPPAQAQRPAAGAQTQQAQPAQQPGAKKQPQARSKEEWDAVQKLSEPTLGPDDKIKLGDEFLQKFPNTELKTFAYRKQMEGYQQKNDYLKMREAGEKVLEEEPNDAVALILLATAIPERTRETDLDRDQKLSQAEDYAQRALAAVDKLEKPSPEMTDADWERVRNDARAQSHAALGLVALQRKQYDGAEAAFKKSLTLQVQKDPVVLWRLGLTYEFAKKYEEARDAYKQSVAAGGVKAGTRDLAEEQLKRVEEFLKRRQAGPPGAGAAAPTPQP